MAFKRVLIVATTTGYQTRSFADAAARLNVELVFATDRCHQLDDPWLDAAVAVRFHDENWSLQSIVAASRSAPIDGIIALGDRPARIAALAADALGLRGNRPEAAEISRNKLETRRRLAAAGLPAPWFRAFPIDSDSRKVAGEVAFPCVVKPLALSGSRGVIRADSAGEFVAAVARLRRILHDKTIRAARDAANDTILVEEFVPGREFAVEGLLHDGALRTLAIFDKPEPLDGPFFEETLYVTPPRLVPDRQQQIEDGVRQAIAAIGLREGPIHAECRVDHHRVVILEVAARPIGGLCARVLRFQDEAKAISFEEVLLRHAIGERVDHLVREPGAAGVMMVPIPRRGVFRGVEGVDAAQRIAGIEDVQITAKPDQLLVPLPEGASYLGFIFARRNTAAEVEQALRAAHQQLKFAIEKELVVSSRWSELITDN